MCFQAKSPSEKSRDQGEKKCWKRETKREKRKEKVLYVENPRSRFRTTSECVPEGPLTPLVKSPASSKGKIPRLDPTHSSAIWKYQFRYSESEVMLILKMICTIELEVHLALHFKSIINQSKLETLLNRVVSSSKHHTVTYEIFCKIADGVD